MSMQQLEQYLHVYCLGVSQLVGVVEYSELNLRNNLADCKGKYIPHLKNKRERNKTRQ